MENQNEEQTDFASEFWNDRFDTDAYVYGKSPNTFLEEMYALIPPGRVLSLAEGEGRNAVFLARMGYSVTGVDSSDVGLQKARRLAEETGVKIDTVLADLCEYDPAPGSFEGIVSIFCHLPSAARPGLYRKIVRALKPGGVFILEAYTPQQLSYGTGGPPTVDRLISLKELQSGLRGLEVVHSVEIERRIREGHYHNGVSHVVQFIGKKGTH